MDAFIKSILNINVWEVGKIFVLMGLAVYIVFAFIVVRQVKLMTEVVFGILTNLLRLVSWTFFLFSISVFILALMFL
ncbi:hypothetical protein COT64_01250 [Candidatus Shapirobacteria bacterium CG09_land_8_20_14_0_10_39_12]|uniref:Uncharacterized protein n=1 Tax=Candidatus Shapirobacteria bacterium CG09_land_8_20_14_0_10_39_12 TaxID=1974885 RepID=A0A2H0WPY4_9BACT|nr:MAG: hypothetical protein COT64_01250 [Candidatus Shapirobacteria bacterium CG09_land_8_20_14_0_10_39_12]